MAKRKVCVSFDYEHDKIYYYLLDAWDKNGKLDFSFNDCTPGEISTESISTIKQVLSRNIGNANYMIAIIGKHSNDKHPDSASIGYRNWQAYVIEKNYEKGNGLVVVKLDSSCVPPEEAYGKGAKWVTGFIEKEINDALKSL